MISVDSLVLISVCLELAHEVIGVDILVEIYVTDVDQLVTVGRSVRVRGGGEGELGGLLVVDGVRVGLP